VKRQTLRLFVLAVAIVGLTLFLTREDLGPDREEGERKEPYSTGTVWAEAQGDVFQVVDTRLAVMGTRFGVEVAAPDEGTGREACRVAYRRIAELEKAMSTWISDSLLSRVNREAAGRPVEVDAATFEVLRRAREYHRVSGGTFDPSIGPLLRVWVPLARLEAEPTDEEIAVARALVGFDRVSLDPETRTVRFAEEGMAIDVGAIAKGYAADEAARVAREAGALACRVTAGGDMVASGAPAWSSDGFEVEIRDPAGGESDFLAGRAFHAKDCGVATSGNYERYTEVGGKRYSHILDPRTGRPVPDAVVQVTVIARDGTEADALATALTVLGPVEGLQLVEGRPGVEALFIVREGEGFEEIASAGFPPRKQ
jgi:thiamine biosynthesis lipoprotein